MRRIVTIEAVDDGFIVRTAGDVGEFNRVFTKYPIAAAFIKSYLLAPEGANPAAISFIAPILEPPHTVALEKKKYRTPAPTEEATVSEQFFVVDQNKDKDKVESPFPPSQPTTKKMPPVAPIWNRPKK